MQNRQPESNRPSVNSYTAAFSCNMRGMTKSHIVLGITGGIAAYKAAELLRLLMKQGVEVQVAMTEAACHFITPTTMQGLSNLS